MPTLKIGWVVDVQNDFMLPSEQGGRLYVRDLANPDDPGATLALAAIRRATDWMRAHCDVVVFTGDVHAPGDAEIDPDAPDPARGTYPPHCMGLSEDAGERRGAEIIEAIRPDDPLVLGRDATPDEGRGIAQAALRERRPVWIQKQRFNVFEGNPAARAFLEGLAERSDGPPEIYVAGVARDVCVTGAIDGMLEMGGARVFAIPEAMWGLGLETEEATLARWSAAGARTVRLDELTKGSP